MSYAPRIRPALEELRDVLSEAGVPASLERDKTPVPGAFVGPLKTVQVDTLAGPEVRLRAAVILVSPENGEPASLNALAALLDKVLAVIEPDGDVDTSLVFPIRTTPLPAWRLEVDLDLEE